MASNKAIDYDITYENSEELCAKMAEIQPTCFLSFSLGKDSLAAWLQCRKYFKTIIPFYMDDCSGMRFIDDSIKYYEDFFGCKIYRFPHPSLFRLLRDYIDQPPARAFAIDEMLDYIPTLKEYNTTYLTKSMQHAAKLPSNVYAALGVRMADSPWRRMSVLKGGAINRNKLTFDAVYDWRKEDLIKAFKDAGVKLAADYRYIGCTYDGLQYKMTNPIKNNLPDDYEKLLEKFPLNETETARFDGIETIKHNNRYEM